MLNSSFEYAAANQTTRLRMMTRWMAWNACGRSHGTVGQRNPSSLTSRILVSDPKSGNATPQTCASHGLVDTPAFRVLLRQRLVPKKYGENHAYSQTRSFCLGPVTVNRSYPSRKQSCNHAAVPALIGENSEPVDAGLLHSIHWI